MKSSSSVLALTVAAAMAFATGAIADGGPSLKDAPRVAPYSWTGLYGGLNVGAASIHDDAMIGTPANVASAAAFGPCSVAGACLLNRGSDRDTGVIGGIQLGYNLQMSNFVVGLEADIQGSTANASRGTFTNIAPFVPFQVAGNTSLEWMGTVRARLGVLLAPTLLAYATGGFAYGSVQHTYGGDALEATRSSWFGRARTDATGWTAGAGLEWAVTNRVTLGAEYLYVTLDAADRFTAAPTTNGTTCNVAAQNCVVGVATGDLDVHIARLKVNYKF